MDKEVADLKHDHPTCEQCAFMNMGDTPLDDGRFIDLCCYEPMQHGRNRAWPACRWFKLAPPRTVGGV